MKTLLFDVDDTLLDFRLVEKKTLYALFEEESVPLAFEVEPTYHRIGQGLWCLFEEGKITKDALLDAWFGLLFDASNREVDSVEMGKNYREYLSQGHDLLGNSQCILEKLVLHYDLYIVTNGVAKTQYRWLEDSKLMPHFKDIFVSEGVGYQKPTKEYFDFVFKRIPNSNREKTMIIGDSLHSDIQGGQQAKIQTIWLNPASAPATPTIQPNYTIQQLDELLPTSGH